MMVPHQTAVLSDNSTARMSTVLGINYRIETTDPDNCTGADPSRVRANAAITAGFRSRHAGGANFTFGDGSVHFLKSSIAIKTWWALGTKASGEVISSDQY